MPRAFSATGENTANGLICHSASFLFVVPSENIQNTGVALVTKQETHCNKGYFFLFYFERFHGGYRSQYFFSICQKYTYDGYTFVPQTKTWSEARSYCNENLTDLAMLTAQSTRDAAIQKRDYPVWIGLHRDGKRKHHHTTLAGSLSSVLIFCSEF